MTTLQLRNSINRTHYRCSFVLVALLFACVSLSPAAFAQATSTKWTQIGNGIINPGTIPDKPKFHHHMCGRIIQAAWSYDNLQGQNILWMGTAVGGLWKSKVDSNGVIKKWVPLTDNFPGPHGMGSFIVNRTDSNKILIGPGGFGSGSEVGDGRIYLTTNQGEKWVGVDLNLPGEKAPVYPLHINRIVADRSDPTGNTVLACTSKGIFRSTAFGAFSSWRRVYSLFEVTDIVQDTGDPQIWYAGALIPQAILRSPDGGKTWHSWGDVYPNSTDPITGSIGRVSLAACAADPNVLYALVANVDANVNGVWRSVTRAKKWTAILYGSDPNFGNDTIDQKSQAKHTCAIGCDPTDPGHIFFGAKEPLEAFNATAKDLTKIQWVGREKQPDGKWISTLDGGHGDYNFVLFRRGFSNIVIANDGGYYTYTPTPLGFSLLDDSGNLLGIEANWLTRDQGGLASSYSDPAEFLAGVQDNGLLRGDTATDTITLMAISDGGQVSISPDNAGILAVSDSGLDTKANRAISLNQGQDWSRITKSLDDDSYSTVLIDPTPGRIAYPFFDTNVFTYSQEGLFSFIYFRPWFDTTSEWRLASVNSAFAVLPGAATHLDHTTNPDRHHIVVTVEGNRHIYVYTGARSDLGSLQLQVNRSPVFATSTNNSTDARVNADKSASQPDTIYYTTGTARPSQAFVSGDCGLTWLEMTKHLGAIPAGADFNKLIRNPLNERQYFLATSQGVYVRDPVTLKWNAFSEGLRLNEDVQDIVINTHNLTVPKLYIATKGRGFWQRAIQ